MGGVAGDSTMNETIAPTTETNARAKRVRRQYDTAFKQSALAHCQRQQEDARLTASKSRVPRSGFHSIHQIARNLRCHL